MKQYQTMHNITCTHTTLSLNGRGSESAHVRQRWQTCWNPNYSLMCMWDYAPNKRGLQTNRAPKAHTSHTLTYPNV